MIHPVRFDSHIRPNTTCQIGVSSWVSRIRY